MRQKHSNRLLCLPKSRVIRTLHPAQNSPQASASLGNMEIHIAKHLTYNKWEIDLVGDLFNLL